MAHAAVFDVDGTLVDTNHLHVITWWEAFRQAGHHVVMPKIHRAIGLASHDLIAHLLDEDRDTEQDAEISGAHSALYGAYLERLQAFDCAGEFLRSLDRRGWRIVLATSAGGSELKALRRAIGADDVILGTASADDVASGKPAPDPVHRALELAEVSASQAVFVGDTVWDMQAAQKAGVRGVAVLSGGIPRSDLAEAGAREIYQDVAELLATLDRGPFAAAEHE